MVNREMKPAIGEELQTLFNPIASATEQVAGKTVEELAPVKKALEDIDGTFKAQGRTIVRPPSPSSSQQKDLTFGKHNEGNTLKVDDKEYALMPGLRMLILYKKRRLQHYNSDDYSV